MISDLLNKSFLENTVAAYLTFAGSFLAGILIIRIIKGIVLRRVKAWAEKTVTTFDDFLLRIIEKKLLPLLYFVAFYLSFKSLKVPAFGEKAVNVTLAVLLTVLIIRITIEVINYAFDSYSKRKTVETGKPHSISGITAIIKVLVWGIGVTFLLDNLGFKISTVIAGLGIGGIAVALAAQTILGDLFSYFVIFFDRPFEIGDFIIVGEYMGSIEYIGIKTTRVRSLGGEQLVFSNTDLTNSRIGVLSQIWEGWS